jgi:hypothetical protein
MGSFPKNGVQKRGIGYVDARRHKFEEIAIRQLPPVHAHRVLQKEDWITPGNHRSSQKDKHLAEATRKGKSGKRHHKEEGSGRAGRRASGFNGRRYIGVSCSLKTQRHSPQANSTP